MRILRSQYLDFCEEQAVDTKIVDATETSVTEPDKDLLQAHIAENELQTFVDTSPSPSRIAENELQTYDDAVNTSLSVSTHGDETQISMPENCQTAQFTRDAQPGQGKFHLEVNVFGRNKHSPPVNIVVQFFDPDAKWFTIFYRKYEGKLWYKFPREPSIKWKKWYYRCDICEQLLCSFPTLKGHLNLHLSFYPSRCTACPKRYATQKALYSHRRAHHAGILV